MVLSKTGMMEANDAATKLTATINGFNIAAQDAMYVVDMLVALDINAATSAKDLATALQYVASSAQMAGMSLSYTLAALATILETTQQAPEMVGTAMRAMVARMQQVKAGKGTAEMTEAINNSEKVLSQYGITIRTVTGDMKDAEEVFGEVAKVWDDLTDVQRNEVAGAMAGVHQREQFIVLMEEYERVLELQTVAMESAGQAQEQMNIYLESTEAHLQQLINQWQLLSMTIVDEEMLNFVLDLGTAFLSLANSVPILTDVAVSVGLLTAGVGALVLTFSSLEGRFDGDELKGWGSLIGKTTKKVNSLTDSVVKGFDKIDKTVTGSNRSWSKSTKLVVGFGATATAILTGINLLINKFHELEAAQQEAVQANEAFTQSFSSYKADTKDVADLTEEFNELAKGVSSTGENVALTNEEYERYNELVNELIAINPDLVMGYNDEGQAIINKNTAIAETNALLEEQLKLEAQAITAPTATEDLAKGKAKNIEDLAKDTEKTVEDMANAMNMSVETPDEAILLSTKEFEDYYKSIESKVEELNKDLASATDERQQSNIENQIAYYEALLAELDKYSDAVKNQMSELQNYLKATAFEVEGAEDLTSELQKFIGVAIKAIEPPEEISSEAIEKWLKESSAYIEDFTNFVIGSANELTTILESIKMTVATPDIAASTLISDVSNALNMIDQMINQFGLDVENKIDISGAWDEKANEELAEKSKMAAETIGEGLNAGISYSIETLEGWADAVEESLNIEQINYLITEGLETIDWEEVVDVDSLEQEINEAMATTQSLYDSFEQFGTEMGMVEAIVSSFTSAQVEMNETGEISIDTFMAMANAIKAVVDSGLGVFLIDSSGGMATLAEFTANATEAIKAKAIAMVRSAEANVYETITSMGTVEANELAAKKALELAQAYAILTGSTLMTAEAQKYYQAIMAEDSGYSGQVQQIASTTASLANNLVATIESVGTSSSDAVAQSAEQMAEDSAQASEDAAKAAEQAAKEAEQAWHDSFNQQYTALNHYYTMGEISAFEYYNELARLTEEYYGNSEQYLEDYWKYEEEVYQGRKQMIDDFYQGVAETAQWAVDQEIEALEEANEVLEDQLDVLEEQKDGWEATVDYATSVIDDQIKVLEDQKKAIQNANEEMEDTNELLKLQNDLYNAQNEQIRVYSESQGFYYTANQEAVDEAQQAVDEYNVQQVLDEIDKQIEAWEAQKEAWESVVDSYIQEQNRLIAAQMFGYDITEAITSGQSQMLIDYATVAYETTMEQIKYIEAQIEANNQEIESLQELNDAWADAADAIQIAQYEMMMNSQYLADFEQQTFEERMKVVEQFTDDYINAMKDIEDAYMNVYDLAPIEYPDGTTYSPSEGTSGGSASGYSSSGGGSSGGGSTGGGSSSSSGGHPPSDGHIDDSFEGGGSSGHHSSVSSQSMNQKSEMQVISRGNAIEDVFSWSKLPMTAMSTMFKQLSYQLNKSSEIAQTKQPNNYYFTITGVKNINDLMAQAERYVLTTGSYM